MELSKTSQSSDHATEGPPSPSLKGPIFLTGFLLVLVPVAIYAFLNVKDFILPLFGLLQIKQAPLVEQTSETSTPGFTFTGDFYMFTSQSDGDSMVATLTTGKTHPKLCDFVMEQIYHWAEKNPSVTRLALTVKVVDKGSCLMKIDDLDAVRKYRDKEAYAASEHRGFIGNLLLSSKVIDELPPAAVPLSGADALIGSTYLYTGSDEEPRVGVYFIDNSQVQLLFNGVASLSPCSYTVEGDVITIPTSCNTIRLTIHGNELVPDGILKPMVKQ